MIRVFLLFALAALLVGSPNSAMAQTAGGSGGQVMQTGDQPQVFVHRTRNFALGIPPKADVQQLNEHGDIGITARSGYKVNVQARDANSQLDLKTMARRLEAEFLGEGKPWNNILSQKESKLSGLPALITRYSGSGSQVQVVIARGAKSDILFIFIAPEERFESFVHEFNWMLASFRPPPEELGMPSSVESSSVAEPPEIKAEAMPEPKPQPAERRKPWEQTQHGRKAQPLPADSVFLTLPELGYHIRYPTDWQVGRPDDHTLLLSGEEGTDAYFATVGVQNVSPAVGGSAEDRVNKVVADLKFALNSSGEEVRVFGERSFTYDGGGLSLDGVQLVAAYRYQGQNFKKWLLVLPRPEGQVVYVWNYTAPETRFDAFRDVAIEILKSWEILSGKMGGAG